MKFEGSMDLCAAMRDGVEKFVSASQKSQCDYETALKKVKAIYNLQRDNVNRKHNELMTENRARKREIGEEAEKIVKDRTLEMRRLEKQYKEDLRRIEAAWKESRIKEHEEGHLTYTDFMAAMGIAEKFLTQAGNNGLTFKWRDKVGRIDFEYQPAEKGGQDE